MSRFVLMVALITVVFGMLIVAFKAERVKTIATICIRADGSVDPSYAPIRRDGDLYVLTDNISGVVIQRNDMTLDGAGLTVQGSQGSRYEGIYVYGRSNVTIKNINVEVFYHGIWLDSSSNNSVSNSHIEANMGTGIVLSAGSLYNSIVENNITANRQGGIFLLGSSNYNNIADNNITTSNYGISLYLSLNNSMYGNNILSNNCGIRLQACSNNSIYHNNFVNNANHVYTVESTNIWDSGYPSGGNYWSNYSGVDLKKGLDQNSTGIDGIGDSPCVIDANNKDNYPLMAPYAAPEDTTPPAIFVVSPENKTYHTNQIALALSVNELTSWIGYCLDGEKNVTIDRNATMSGLPEGRHSTKAFANDSTGNMGHSETVYFTVDTIPPLIRILTPENKTYTTEFILVAFDIDESASWIGYSLDGQANETLQTQNATLDGLSNGSHTLVIYANDSAGNTGTSERAYFCIDVQRTEPFQAWIVAAIGMTAEAVFVIYHIEAKKKSRAKMRG